MHVAASSCEAGGGFPVENPSCHRCARLSLLLLGLWAAFLPTLPHTHWVFQQQPQPHWGDPATARVLPEGTISGVFSSKTQPDESVHTDIQLLLW